MISCLMVTQPGRLALARLAIADFAAQTHRERELLVLHDGDADLHAELERAAATHGAAIRVLRQPARATLGSLRNAAVVAAMGDFICQWDDDDRFHPERLALQWQALHDAQADFCFLTDQLHWFPASGDMFWDDWSRESHPFDVVQGTLLGRRSRMPRYPDAVRGEDTALLVELLRSNEKIARLRDAGWCYAYVYHGRNAFEFAHHVAISRAKALGFAALLRRERTLRQRLGEYRPGFGAVRFPHEAGHLDMATPARPG